MFQLATSPAWRPVTEALMFFGWALKATKWQMQGRNLGEEFLIQAIKYHYLIELQWNPFWTFLADEAPPCEESHSQDLSLLDVWSKTLEYYGNPPAALYTGSQLDNGFDWVTKASAKMTNPDHSVAKFHLQYGLLMKYIETLVGIFFLSVDDVPKFIRELK